MNGIFHHHSQIKVVSSFHDLIHTNFQAENNALCWERNVQGDFGEIVSKLQLSDNITEISSDDLMRLELSEDGKLARDIILNDLQQLTDFGASPALNLLKSYEKDTDFDCLSTDVYSFHVDRSPIAIDTYLCTYYGASSEIISNSEAEQKILIPETREKLKELHTNSGEDFETFLTENFFDLHYQSKPDAQPTVLGNGHLWRLAVDHPEQKVLPCIHRAPHENNQLRLMLIC